MVQRSSRSGFSRFLVSGAIGVMAIVPVVRAGDLAQTPSPTTAPSPQPTDSNDELKPLNQSDSLLSYRGGQRLMEEANAAINSGDYTVAADKLNQARRIFNQLSNYHLQLANSFSGIDPKVFDAQRQSALTTGQSRDEATYQLALVHRAQNQPELAVPLLIQVIQSQNPTSELGRKCYQQLYEMGFVSTPFVSPSAGPQAPATAPNARQ
jgi:thioredoxin-like negative regulator of GroEL